MDHVHPNVYLVFNARNGANQKPTVPNLTQRRISTPIGTLRPTASQIRHGPKGTRQRSLDIAQAVRGAVARHDARGGEPGVRRQRAVPGDGGRKEVDDVLVRHVLRAVAGHVKGAVAGGVL